MRLLDLEIYVAKKGVLGCPLTEIPKELFSEFERTKMVEIVLHEDNLEMPIMLVSQSATTKLYRLKDLESYEGYDARLNFDSWRVVIFNGTNIRSTKLAKCCMLLIEHPEGLDRNFIEKSIPAVKSDLSFWMSQLKSSNAIIIERKGNKQIFKYNFDMLKKERELLPDIYSETNNEPLISNPVSKANEAVNKKEAEEKEDLVSRVLKTPLSQDIKEARQNADEIAKTEPSDGGINKSTELVNTDTLDQIVNLCKIANILVLSELPKQIKKLKAGMKITEDEFLETLEDNGFKVIEIRSKYISTEYIVFPETINEKDALILKVVDRLKKKITNYFKVKVKLTFLKNTQLNSFDNNYVTNLKVRVMYFYEYLVVQMKKNGGCFYFNLESLLDMNFVSFIKCVPLRLDFQFLKIATEFIKKTGKEAGALQKKMEDLENLEGADFERLNRKCLQILEENTIREVLEGIAENTELFKNLSQRVNINEFDKILQSLVKYNIFDGYADDSFLYFEYLENIEKYLENLPFDMKDDSTDSIGHGIPFSDRKRFYDMICEFSQEEFYLKVQSIIDENFQGETRAFLTMKLQSFK